MKNNSNHKNRAATKHVVRLAQKTAWRDIKLPSGEVVSAETTQQIFDDAAKALKSKSRRKRAHAAA